MREGEDGGGVHCTYGNTKLYMCTHMHMHTPHARAHAHTHLSSSFISHLTQLQCFTVSAFNSHQRYSQAKQEKEVQ